jgi:hypothetical protein
MNTEMVKVFDKAQDLGVECNKVAVAMDQVIQPKVETFKIQLEEMCKTLTEMKDALSGGNFQDPS